MGRRVIDPEIDHERFRRALSLDDGALRRFLMVTYGTCDQWYWTAVERIDRLAFDRFRLVGIPIPMTRATVVYGIELYDDEGRFVSRGNFPIQQYTVSGDSLRLTYAMEG